MAKASAKATASAGPKLVADTTVVSAEAGTEASALGDATLATGSVTLKGRDAGQVTLVKGSAEATAAATGDGAYANAGTFCQVDGADLVISRTVLRSGDGADGSAATSETFTFAIDLNRFDFSSGPRLIELYAEGSLDIGTLTLDGNVATVEAHATAAGDATYALALTDAYASVGAADVTGYAQVLIG